MEPKQEATQASSPTEHRHTKPSPNITYESLFANCESQDPPVNQWPNDDMVGAEYDTWCD